MRCSSGSWFFAVVLLVAAAAPARADLQATFINENPGAPVNVSGFSPNSARGISYSGSAGQMNFKVTGGSNATAFGGAGASLATFCVDLVGYVGNTNTYNLAAVTPQSPGIPELTSGATGVAQLRNLYGAHFNATDLATATGASAFQDAVWAIVYDGGTPDINTGALKFGSRATGGPVSAAETAAESQAQQWLKNIGTTDNGAFAKAFGASGQLVALVSPNGPTTGQDQLTVIPGGGGGGGGGHPVPAPAGLVLGLVGMAVLGVRRRLA